MALWIEDYVQVNKYSRPALPLVEVLGVILHWTGNAGADDEDHANFFDGADGGGERYASAHLFVDRDSVRLIVPLNEVAYHANEKPSKVAKFLASTGYYKGGNANLKTIGVEMCVEKDGTIHQETIDRTILVVAELCRMFDLTEEDVYRHYDITGKNCPKPFVEDVSKLHSFKDGVKKELAPKYTHKVIIPNTAFWQARNLVKEYEGRGFKCQGVSSKVYGKNEKPADNDPYKFVLFADYENAKQLVIELKIKGYDRTYGTKNN